MFKPKRIAVVLFLAILFSCSAFFLRKVYVAPILMYHSVDPEAKPANKLAVTPSSFRRQMSFLKRHNYNIVKLTELAALIKEGKRIPPGTVAITFDDGYKDNFSQAFGILKELNIPATIFVIVNEVGRPDRLSWQEIREMASSGLVSIGSHALGPEPLINIKSESELKRQIFYSKRILEEKLGKPVAVFSYAGGFFNDKIKNLVIEAGYKLAVTTNPGKRFPNNDIFALKRLRISASSDNLLVFWFEASGYYNFIRENRHK